MNHAELNDPWAMFGDPKKNWQEDYRLDNGNYQCRCVSCKNMFMGLKGRIICRECYNTDSNKLNNIEMRRECLDSLHTDFLMLEDGSWDPDRQSVAASLETVQKLGKLLNLEPKDIRG